MLESGVFVRDHGTRLEEIQMKDSGMMLEITVNRLTDKFLEVCFTGL